VVPRNHAFDWRAKKKGLDGRNPLGKKKDGKTVTACECVWKKPLMRTDSDERATAKRKNKLLCHRRENKPSKEHLDRTIENIKGRTAIGGHQTPAKPKKAMNWVIAIKTLFQTAPPRKSG